MYFPTILITLLTATMGMAYSVGEIPSHYAIRATNGEVSFIHEVDRREFEATRLSTRQVVDPQSDTYPVKNDGSGVKPYIAADGDKAAVPA